VIQRLHVYPTINIPAEEFDIAEWAFDSHFWVENPAGYYICKRCNMLHTSMQAIHKDYQLCSKNPALIKLMGNQIKLDLIKPASLNFLSIIPSHIISSVMYSTRWFRCWVFKGCLSFKDRLEILYSQGYFNGVHDTIEANK
jgi:hypothetical protein